MPEPEPEPEPAGLMHGVTDDDVREWSELVASKQAGGKSAKKLASRNMAALVAKLSARSGAAEPQLRSELNQAMHGVTRRPANAPSAGPKRRDKPSSSSSSGGGGGGSCDEACLYAVQHRHKPASPADTAAYIAVERPLHVAPATEAAGASPAAQLGPLDARFAQDGRRPTLVALLLSFPAALDQDRLVAAMRVTLSDFPTACGRRIGTTIAAGPGVRFSAIRVEDQALCARPPPRYLFDPPPPPAKPGEAQGEDAPGAAVLTLRLATGQGGQLCSVGVCFDHALCDISGVALWLSHVSTQYSALGLSQPRGHKLPHSPSTPHHARGEQARIAALCACEGHNADTGEEQTALDHREGEEMDEGSSKAGVGGRGAVRATAVPKGGCVCVEWTYTAAELQQLKAGYQAYSRHDACFADVLLLLRNASSAVI
eukprot:COSAG06_NODE_3481_length_5281_cov_121.074489_1_plen_428_part_10